MSLGKIAFLLLFIVSIWFQSFSFNLGNSVNALFLDSNSDTDYEDGTSIVLKVREGCEASSDEMKVTLAVIEHRLDASGFVEARAYIDGPDCIQIDIPNIKVSDRDIKRICGIAQLSYIGVDWSSLISNDMIMDTFYQQYVEEALAEMTEKEQEEANKDVLFQDAVRIFQLEPEQMVKAYPQILEQAIDAGFAEIIFTNDDVARASYQNAQYDSSGSSGPYISLELNSEGTDKFKVGTETYLNQYIAIRLDEMIFSMPIVNSVITNGQTIITGIFTEEEAKALADEINGGPLPIELEIVEVKPIGMSMRLKEFIIALRTWFSFLLSG